MRFMLNLVPLFRAVAVVVLCLAVTSGSVMASDISLDLNEVGPGRLFDFSP